MKNAQVAKTKPKKAKTNSMYNSTPYSLNAKKIDVPHQQPSCKRYQADLITRGLSWNTSTWQAGKNSLMARGARTKTPRQTASALANGT